VSAGADPVPAARILVVDDEPQIRKFLEISLRSQGYAVSEAATAREGLERLAVQGADLVVLDLGLPDLDGHEALREIRGWSSVPVIVLSVRSSDAEKVEALDAGASDYVTKPFSVQELMARIRRLLRKRDAPLDAAPVFDDGRVRIDLFRRSVAVDGQELRLSRKEFALLSLLVQHAGLVVTQGQLLREIWGPSHVEDTQYLRVVVGKIRQKLGDDPAAPRYVRTEPGVGYRFVGESGGTTT
jgi:two-component system KDP operon response regulator KdpE